MDKLAKQITDYYVRKNIIDEDKREIYTYGFKLIFADIINYLIVIIMGIIFKRIAASVAFLITLCGVRQFSGGFHAKTFWLCRLSMILTYVLVIILADVITKTNNVLLYSLVINILCTAFIGVFAPIEHENKPLTKKQKEKNKIRSLITAFVLSVVSIIMVIADMQTGVTISVTLLAVILLMFISMVMKKGGNSDVQLD